MPEDRASLASPLLKNGQRFHGLEIIEVLGRGGMGVVYKARQASLDRLVALKTISSDKATQKVFKDRFHREAKALASLVHPNILSIFDFGEEQDLYFFLMEYVEGVNLREYAKARTLSEEDVRGILLQVCGALEWAHSKGVVHRDIKPENILIDENGRVKVADFGLAKFTEAHADDPPLTMTGAAMGTPYYMAPEQSRDTHHVDERADIYSIGVTLYELLTDRLPHGSFVPPSVLGKCSPSWDAVVQKALSARPEDRHRTIKQFLEDLKGTSSTSTGNETKRSSPLKWIAASVLVLLAVGVGVVVALQNRNRSGKKPEPVSKDESDKSGRASLHLSESEGPSGERYLKNGPWLRPNPFRATDLDSLDTLTRQIGEILALPHLTFRYASEGYAARWPSCLFFIIKSKNPEESEAELRQTSWRFVWTHREGSRVILVAAQKRDAHKKFVDLVHRVQQKCGLPEEDPK